MMHLGIDPGTTTLGYALIEKSAGGIISLRDYGVISTPPKIDPGKKLCEIRDDLEHILQLYPMIISAGVEKLYFTNNITTGMAVSECRGVVIELLTRYNIRIHEFTPLQVKKGICGNGSAQKKQIQAAVQSIFSLEKPPKPDDAADAIALAYLTSIQR